SVPYTTLFRSIAGFQHLALGPDGDLKAAFYHDAGLLTLMREHAAPGVGPRLIDLMQHLQCLARQIAPDLAIGNFPLREAGQLALLIENLVRRGEVACEKLRKADGKAVEHFFERADRRARPVLLDHRDGAVGDARAFGKLALRQAMLLAQAAQARAEIEFHRCLPYDSDAC